MKNLSHGFLGCEELLYGCDDTSPSSFLADFEQTLAAFTRQEAASSIFFRARVGSKEENRAFQGDEMQAPPPGKGRGRINTACERVLYCAEEVGTAISEIRPARGMHVSVCQLTLHKEAKLLDLTVPLATINKSLCAGRESSIPNLKSILRILRDELSRPLEGNDNDDAYQYQICHRLGRYLRQSNYDGIRYPSALKAKGRNLVFFDPAFLVVGRCELAKIKTVNVSYELDSSFRCWGRVLKNVGASTRKVSRGSK